MDINKVTEMSYRLKVSLFVTSILIEGASQNIGVPYRYLHVLEENKNKYNAFLLVNISTAIFLVLSWQCVSLTYKVFYCQIFKIALILYFETLDKAFPGNIKLKNIKGTLRIHTDKSQKLSTLWLSWNEIAEIRNPPEAEIPIKSDA